MKKNNKSIIKAMVVLLCILIVVGVLVFVTKNKKDDDKTDTKAETTEEIVEENEELYVEDTESFDIKTSYGNLQFPEAWKDTVKTKIVNKGDVEIVEFWLELEGKDKIHMFDIIFGGEGYTIGSIKTADSEDVTVSVESYSYELDDSWSDSDKAILSAIDHDINFLLENLTSLEGFSPVE